MNTLSEQVIVSSDFRQNDEHFYNDLTTRVKKRDRMHKWFKVFSCIGIVLLMQLKQTNVYAFMKHSSEVMFELLSPLYIFYSPKNIVSNNKIQ